MRKFSIGRWGLVAGALLLMGGLAGCGGKQDIPETAPQGMSVDSIRGDKDAQVDTSIDYARVGRGPYAYDLDSF